MKDARPVAGLLGRLASPHHDFAGRPFPARDDRGGEHLLTPLYRLKPTPDGWERDPSLRYLVGLRTEDGLPVVRSGRGRYVLVGRTEAAFVSDHPDAV